MANSLRPFLIGTAGHVDHGKTTLVQSLTGVNTDRLEEEQRRGMSIDLGFAEFRLPSGRMAGVVDVPGHERFLKNMLAGAAGVDFAVLVVAADEGVMPQTREHLAILQALRIPRGLVVLTKADTVDAEWLDLAASDVRAALEGTFLENAPLLTVDSVSRRGLDALAAALDETAAALPAPDLQRPAFLPVDRVFQRPGFGVVVTGSLRTGRLREGDAVTIYPGGKTARVRGLQTFGQKETEAEAGMRTAVNLAGINTEDVRRGDVIAPMGTLSPSERINVRLELNEGTRVLKHRVRVRVHLGTAEILARVLLWEGAELRPGAAAMAQLHLEEPAVARRGDRFVVRSYSPQDVLGGGVVLEPAALPFRARDAAVVRRLCALEGGDAGGIVREILAARGNAPTTAKEIAAQTGLPEGEVAAALEGAGGVRSTSAGYIAETAFQETSRRWTGRLAAFHKKFPLRPGLSKEELRTQDAPPLPPPPFAALLDVMQEDGSLTVERDLARLPDFAVRLRPDQQATADQILAAIEAGGWMPPAEYELVRTMGQHRATREMWDYLTASAQLLPLGEGVYLHRSVVNAGLKALDQLLRENGRVTAAQFRDAVGASRRAAIPFLEWCDTKRYTRRVGDAREAGVHPFPNNG